MSLFTMQGYAGYEISCSLIWRLSFRESLENQKLCCISSPTPAQLCPVKRSGFYICPANVCHGALALSSKSIPIRGRLRFKRSVALKLWTGDFYRQTRDIDVLAFKSQTIDSLKAIFKDICQISFLDDGLTYLSDTVKVEEIREDHQYGGYCVTLTAMLGKAKIHLQVDCGFGDAITPEASVHDFPTFLDFPAPRLRMYPKETVVAEKFEVIQNDLAA